MVRGALAEQAATSEVRSRISQIAFIPIVVGRGTEETQADVAESQILR